jgi:uncharacterized short protein YbdD (DUF466 family)
MLLKNEDGDFQWKPSLKQEKFLSIPLTVKEGFYAGAVMAGKSDVLLMYPLVHGWHRHPQFKGIFLRRTMPELRLEIIPRAKEYFAPFGGKYNVRDACFEFPSGALYFMAHCEHEDDVHNYDSMQPNYAAFDELTSFTEWIYTYITIERVRVVESLKDELPAIVRSGSNPGNIGHQFVYKRFIKPHPEGGKILVGRGGIKRLFIQATIDDNPHASKQYKQELDALPEAERRAKKLGDWSAYEGQVFDELRDKRFAGEPDNAYHMVAPFEIPPYWPRIVAIDWGFNAMCSVGWGAIGPDNRVYVYRHQMFFKLKIEEWGPLVKEYVDKEHPSDVVICHSANQHRGDPHTILEQVNEVLDVQARLGERDRVGGKALLHEYLRWAPKPKLPIELKDFDDELARWLLRNEGLESYKNYIKHWDDRPDNEVLPRLKFFDIPECRAITEAIKSCVYEKADKNGKKKEDVAEFEGDDPYDMLRLLLNAADVFFGVASYEQERLKKISEVIEKMKVTQDMTSFYRNMKRVEVEDVPAIQPVRRFHHARNR